MSWKKRLLIGCAAAFVVLAGYTTYSVARPTVLTTSIEIEAGPERVWAVLSDRAAYGEWNPFIISSTGDLVTGSTITNVMRDATGKDSTFTPTVLVATPNQELRWLGRVGPGAIFDGEHTFRIEPLGPGRVRLVQEERFQGVLVPFMRGWLRDSIEPQFIAMNEALAKRVR
ncbi:SRPBCC family protein [Kribbella deserti]|uniref:SRPBCC family protein n=1 Tax=Kribbella deserti TaxID=1926257 RepID=A0ABV6QM05_9ACTN